MAERYEPQITAFGYDLTKWEEIAAMLNDIAHAGRQVPAAFTDMLLPSPEAVKDLGFGANFIPSGVWQVGSLAEMGLDRLDAMLTEGDQPFGAQPLGRMTDYADSTGQVSNEMWDVDYPNTMAEMALRGFVPGPGLGTSMARSTLGNMARGAARTMADIALPGISARSIPGLAFQGVAVPAGISTLVEDLSPAYGEVLPDPNPMIDVGGDGADVPEPLPAPNIAPRRTIMGLDANGQWVPMGTEPMFMTPEEEQDRNYSDEIIAGAASGLAILFGGATARRGLAQAYGNNVAANSQLMGTAPAAPPAVKNEIDVSLNNPFSFGAADQFTPRSTVIKGQLVDQNAPLTYGAERATGRRYGGQIMQEVRTKITSAAAALRNENFFRTGRFIDSGQRAVPLTRIMNAMSRLEAPDYALLSDALIAESKLDDLQRLGTRIWGTGANQVTDLDLQDISKRARRNPYIAQILNETQGNLRAAAMYLEEGPYGIIDAATRDSWINGPNGQPARYTPIQRDVAVEEGNLIRDVASLFRATEPELQSGMPEYLQAGKRGPKGLNEIVPGEVRSPIETVVDYLTRIQRYKVNNEVRGKYLDLLARANMKMKNGSKLIISYGTAKPNDMTQVQVVMKRGVPNYYKVNDAAIFSRLQFTPSQIIPILNMTRQFAQQMTSGLGAPLFVIKSMMYEAGAAYMMGKAGRGLGIIDKALGDISEAFTGKRFYLSHLKIPDPSVVLNAPIGAVRILIDQMKPYLAEGLDMQLRSGGALKSILGQRGLEAMRDVIMRSFERSTLSEMQRLGADNAAFYTSDPFGGVPRDIMHLAPQLGRKLATSWGKQAGAGLGWRTYTNILSAFHNGTRYMAFDANRPHGFYLGSTLFNGRKVPVVQTSADEIALADDIRRLTGDPAQVPGDPNTRLGRNYQKFVVSPSMYINHSIQALAQNARAMREDPIRYMMAIGSIASGFVIAMEAWLDDPEFRKTYTQDMTAAQRARMIPVPGGDSPDGVGSVIAIPQEMRLWLAPYIEAYLAFTGRTGNPTAQANLLQGMSRDTLFEFSELDIARLDESLATALQSIAPDPTANPFIKAIGSLAFGQEMPSIGMGQFEAQAPWRNRADPWSDEDVSMRERFRMAAEELLAGAARPMFDAIDAIGASLDHNQSLGRTVDNAANAFFGGMREPENAGPFTSLWGLDVRISTSTPEHNLARAATSAVKEILGIGRDIVRAPTGADVNEPGFPVYTYNPNAQGTELALVRNYADSVQKTLTRIGYYDRIGEIQDNLGGLALNPVYSDPEVRRIENNRLIEELRTWDRRALSIINQIEHVAGNALGDPDFSFALYDPREGSTRPLPLQ